MKIIQTTPNSRRAFLRESAGAAVLASAFGSDLLNAPVAFAKSDAPDPNDPNDPNAIRDEEHEIGQPYRGWKQGELDLHFIHTGISENTFHIYPDGTTALVDCGDRPWKNFGAVSWNHTHSDAAACQPKPDDSKRCGEWVARYIARLLPDLKTIDYVVASHFHSDHTGCVNVGLKMTEGLDENYMISGISHVGQFYRFGTAFDRGYPTYDQPSTWAPNERENLLRFWNHQETEGLKREEFRVGALDQIKLLREPEKYNFHIRNLARNGVAWNGEGRDNIDFFALNPKNVETNKNENTRSLAMVVQYGDFRFYTGGDLSGVLKDSQDKDADYEGHVGRVTGPVAVCKPNHHSSSDAMRSSFIEAIQARVYITCCWWMGHTVDKTGAAMCNQDLYSGPRLLCPTDVHPMNAETLKDKPWRKYMCEKGGHVVVKVCDGGAKYKVYFLTADDESMRVNLVFGPFDSVGGKNCAKERVKLARRLN